ncbi:MAG TPA: hypothetical protein VHP58_01990 [Alphaproteobacteria bacterium]|nr:hypothetical protein [Alphaproteobacteria bacterium]
MPTLLEQIMANSANTPVIEALRHSSSCEVAADNPAHTDIASYPPGLTGKEASAKKLLENSPIGLLKVDVSAVPGGKIAVLMRLPFPKNEVEEAIKYIRKSSNPQRIVPRGTPPDTPRNSLPRSRPIALNTT